MKKFGHREAKYLAQDYYTANKVDGPRFKLRISGSRDSRVCAINHYTNQSLK